MRDVGMRMVYVIAIGFHCGPACAELPTSAQKACERPLVGVNYFAGWRRELPNKWHGQGWNADQPDWRPEFPERVPRLDQYNDQTTMDGEIAVAGHAVDFMAILWYYPKPGSRRGKYASLLNKGLETCLASDNVGRMHFFIEYCNSPDFSASGEEQWAACVATWVSAVKHPDYAWNAFGEGGITAPTKGRGHMMLQCIKDDFGMSDSAHEGRASKQTETQ